MAVLGRMHCLPADASCSLCRPAPAPPGLLAGGCTDTGMPVWRNNRALPLARCCQIHQPVRPEDLEGAAAAEPMQQ